MNRGQLEIAIAEIIVSHLADVGQPVNMARLRNAVARCAEDIEHVAGGDDEGD